jgi:hypothetical protein
MKPVDTLDVQVSQRFPVLGQGQCLGLQPPHPIRSINGYNPQFRSEQRVRFNFQRDQRQQ